MSKSSPPLLFASFLLSRLSGLLEATRQQLAGDETGVCHTSIGVRIDTFAECETEVAFGATYQRDSRVCEADKYLKNLLSRMKAALETYRLFGGSS